MESFIKEIVLTTTTPIQVMNITDEVSALLSESGVKNGFVNVITNHTTSAININEEESGLQKDMLSLLTSFVPRGAGYLHDKGSVDGRGNAHSHLMAMFMNASEAIPINEGKMVLGKWQSIFFIELDGPRVERKVTVQIVGK